MFIFCFKDVSKFMLLKLFLYRCPCTWLCLPVEFLLLVFSSVLINRQKFWSVSWGNWNFIFFFCNVLFEELLNTTWQKNKSSLFTKCHSFVMWFLMTKNRIKSFTCSSVDINHKSSDNSDFFLRIFDY